MTGSENDWRGEPPKLSESVFLNPIEFHSRAIRVPPPVTEAAMISVQQCSCLRKRALAVAVVHSSILLQAAAVGGTSMHKNERTLSACVFFVWLRAS